MPPTKSKFKQEKPIPETVYKFFTSEEWQVKEQKYANHMKNLEDCLNYVKESTYLVNQLNEHQLTLTKWQEYVNCFPLPRAYIPPDIRLFLEKLKHFENVNKNKTIDWILSVDERSVLTQNLYRKDLTRSTLSLKKKTTFEEEYNKDIENCLQIMKRLDDFLDNDKEVEKCGLERLNDIKELRSSLQEEIAEFFNRFTYRILCSEEAYMKSLDATTTEYSFQNDNFQMHIWSVKNVPISAHQLEGSCFETNLHGVKVILHLPDFFIKQSFTIRALHMNFDHISENVKCFLKDREAPLQTLSFEEPDLVTFLANERSMQLELQSRVRNELMQKRLENEEKLQLLEEQEAMQKNKRNKKTNKSISENRKQNISNPTRESIIHDRTEPDDQYPDIFEEFLEEEQKQYKQYMNNKYNPMLMDLDSDEINLQKYSILGGIYQFYQVEKPKHTDFDSFNMTWHCNNSKLVIDKNVVVPLHPTSHKRPTKEPSEPLKVQQFTQSGASQCPWFTLTVQLPEYLCYWGQPIVTQYEDVTKVKITQIVSQDNEDFTKTVTKPLETLTEEETDLGLNLDPKYLPFFKPHKEGLTNSVLKLQQISPKSFFKTVPSKIRFAHKEHFIKELARDPEGFLNIVDFPLNTLLDKDQIRHLEIQIIPRMLSSFKFPKEIREDKLKAMQDKSEANRRLLFKGHPRNADKQSAENKPKFVFGPMKGNPERIIPFYTPDEPIRIISEETDIEDVNFVNKEPKTFAQLVKVIHFIKWQYKMQVRKILDLKPFNEKRKQKFESLANLTKSTSKLNVIRSVHKKLHSSKSVLRKPLESNILTSLRASGSGENMHETNKNGDLAENLPTYTYGHWTTRHIIKSEYDREKHAVVIQTNRLGYFGFAFKQYEHFPFKFWQLEPNPNDPENEINFILDTKYVRCIFYISEKGIRGYVTECTKKFKKNPKIFLNLEEPLANLKDLKKIFKEKHLNVFPAKDAGFYIENDYFSEKLLSLEIHTYNCIAAHCSQIKFSFSHWNRLALRRDIILKFLQYQDPDENTVEVLIKPEESFFVEISELCSDNVDVIKLGYNLTWRNIDTYSDLNQLINSIYPAAKELRCKNPYLLNFVQNLLYEIRPLSFS